MTEQISALVDNDIRDENIFDNLIKDVDANQQWQRYHLIGDIMRDEHQPGLNFDIAKSVAIALQAESAHCRLQSSANDPQELGGENTSSVKKPSNVVNLFTRGGHYAIAASVAVAVLLGVSQFSTPTIIASPESHQVFDTVPFSGGASPVSLQFGHSEPEFSQSNTQLSDEELLAQKKRINAFLQDHQMQLRK